MDDRINMTADEFFDHWSQLCSMTVTIKEAELLSAVLVSILKTFEERGSPTHRRGVLNGFKGTLFESPDERKEPN